MNRRILIVDDEEMIRLLYRAGYEVDTASSGAEAIKKVSQGDFGLVVLDIELSDMSGLEVLQKLRKIAPETHIILNSAYTTYKSDFQSWLADGYIVKSSDLGELMQKIKQLVAAR